MKGIISIPKFLKRLIRLLVWIFGSFITLVIILSLLLLIPTVQTFVTKKAAIILSEKTNMEIQVGSVHIGLPKTVKLGSVFIKDPGPNEDTLFHCSSIKIDADILPLFWHKIYINKLVIDGILLNAYNSKSDSLFNFQPIVDVFNTPNNTTIEPVENSWEIDFNNIKLLNINGKFHNWIDSTRLIFNLGHISITANSIDINARIFDLESIDIQKVFLSISLAQKKSQEKTNDTSIVQQILPFDIDLSTLNLDDIHFELNLNDRELVLLAELEKANLKPETINLNTSEIYVSDILGDGINISLEIPGNDTHKNHIPGLDVPDTNNTFGDFPWKLALHHTEFTNSNFSLYVGQEPEYNTGVEFWPLVLTDIYLLADSMYFNKLNTGINLKELQLIEEQGPCITQFKGLFALDNQSFRAENMVLSTLNSSMSGDVLMGYSSFQRFTNAAENIKLQADIEGQIQINEVSQFVSIPNQFVPLSNVDQIDITALKVKGHLDNLNFEVLNLGLGNTILVTSNSSIKGLLSTDLEVDLEIDTLITTSNELKALIPDSLFPTSISIPNDIGLTGSFKYKPGFMDLNTEMKTSNGNLELEAELVDDELSSILIVQSLDIGQLLNDSLYGEIMMDCKFNGTQSNGNLNNFITDIDVESMAFSGYTYTDFFIHVERKDDLFIFNSSINDSILNFIAKGEAIIVDSVDHYTLDMMLHHADLKKMNLYNEDLSISGNFDINTNFKSVNEIDGNFHLSDILLANENGNRHIKEVKLITDINKDYTNFDLSSDILNVSLTGNTQIIELKTAFYNHINNYIDVPDSLLSEKDYHFDFNLSLINPAFFTDFLISELDSIEIGECNARYDSKKNLFESDIRVSKFYYSNWGLDDLSCQLNSYGDSVLSFIQLGQFTYDSSFLKNVSFTTKFKDQEVDWTMNVFKTHDSLKYSVETNVTHHDGAYFIRLNPKKLILDQQQWYVDPNNVLIIKDSLFYSESFLLTNNNQAIKLDFSEDHLNFNFNQFNIQNVTNFLNKEHSNQILKGELSGNVNFTNIYRAEFNSDLFINNLSYGEDSLGDLNILTDLKSNEKLNYSLKLSDDKNYVKLDGILDLIKDNRKINAILTIDIRDVNFFSGLVGDKISSLDGKFSGDLDIKGEIDNPKINGKLNMEDFSIMLASQKAYFKLNGLVNFKDNIIEFRNFSISDSLKNPLSVKGSIDARNMIDPNFNLKLNSSEFLLINSKEEKGKSIIGKLFLGVDASIDGKISNLVINSDFTINNNTDIMYVLPGNELELVSDEGIVSFTDIEYRSDTSLIAGQAQFIENSLISMIHGVDLTIGLKIDPQAKFSLYIDPNSGDITSFRLNGYLTYKYNDSQRGNLNGKIELNEGFYQLSFYGLINRRFEYDPGSTISWSGNIMDGMVNFSARHLVRTTSEGLLSSNISSYARSMYNKRLPYEVILNVNTKISDPQVSFGIDLPVRYKDNNPIIASKLNMLNQPGFESELNKQVFALLVSGSFVPDNPNVQDDSSSDNFATTAARKSVNAIMTKQLNNFSRKLITGVDVDFGVNTFNDYSSGNVQSGTQLDVKVSKNLFNDRLAAEVESHIDIEGNSQAQGSKSTLGMTEFAVSYEITKSRNLRIKAFRENAYDIFDGEIQNSGIGIIYIKEFESFRKKPKSGELPAPNEINNPKKSEQTN